METKSSHPDEQLFDYLNGSLDQSASREIEQHLSLCDECAQVSDIVRALKLQSSNFDAIASEAHPDVSEMVSFFYGKPSGDSHSKSAAHVAGCRNCVDELALYAQAERAAAQYDPALHSNAEIPESAWQLINDWEDTIFARPKPEIEPVSEELMRKLARLLEERKEHLSEMGREMAAPPRAAEAKYLVPVIIVDKSGEFRGMEMFESATGPGGASVLIHAEHSERFDNKPFHALLDYGENRFAVMTYLVRRDTVKLQRASQPEVTIPCAGYFIVED